jgi:hypothetical protein
MHCHYTAELREMRVHGVLCHGGTGRARYV